MNKIILLATVSILTTTAFATTITCVGGEVGINAKGSANVLELEALKKAPSGAVILEKDGAKFLLTISNIYTPEKDGSETILSIEAMVLSKIVDNKNISSTISDGKNLMYFEVENNTSVMCTKN